MTIPAVTDTPNSKKMTKRIRKRNWVATQWIPALEVGGGEKTIQAVSYTHLTLPTKA